MDLNKAIAGLIATEAKLRTSEGVNNPVFISMQMMILSQYTGAVEEHLANIEEEEEIAEADSYHRKIVIEHLSPSAAEKAAKYHTAEQKGNIKKLTRLVNSAWKIVGVAQSRVNHLTKEAGTQL